MKKIGIIGNGFVGSSVQFGFSAQTGCNAQVKIYDVNPSKSTHTLSEVVNLSEFIFMSVPTPSNENGSINLDIIYDAFEKKVECKDKYIDNVILIRSTVTPGTTRTIQEQQ